MTLPSYALYMSAYWSPVFTWDQLVRLGIAERIIRQAIRHRYLEVVRGLASPPSPLLLPSFTVCPGQNVTRHVDAWVYAIASRPTNPPREIDYLRFTARGANLVGAPAPNFSQPFQVSHHLQIPEMMIATRALEPALGDGWVGEAFFRARHPQALKGYAPDIAVLSPGGKIKRAIDYASGSGAYSAERLRLMIDVCQTSACVLEVW